MAFIQHLPLRLNTIQEREVRVSITGKNNWIHLNIMISKKIAEDLNFKNNDRVNIFYDDENKKIWKLTKSKDNYGYRLYESGKNTLRLSLRPNIKNYEFSPSRSARIEYEIKNKELLLNIEEK